MFNNKSTSYKKLVLKYAIEAIEADIRQLKDRADTLQKAKEPYMDLIRDYVLLEGLVTDINNEMNKL